MDAPNNTAQPQDSQATVPKDNSPPPAYTPRRVPDLTTLTARAIQARQGLASMIHSMQSQQQQAPFATLHPGAMADDQDEVSEDSSPICLRINTSVNVSRSNNIVCLTATPAEQANAISRAVVQALNEGSSGRCGIPMIDESGCPRPLKIEVDAGIVVEGTGNVVGGREVVGELLRRRAEAPLRRPREEDDDEEASAAKRRRSSQ
ncbi:uncharacterized protein NECHADRAFT_74969 [Fusarium vanettenii 77-13-4]|uniref:Uncharacterized protein n=1 Tax=Fusarium vanettenii (strain ATCC MYA-4622 / CBS 123669 / FGSC 9596 / NRRL 45880 / 77-13-4) TaxID=660122 RepID=C7YHH1_FUSV7|nr:uncharacterized protein NECHADRAFT_74969 [Fusarium vanettenii 77-13-4]EEU48636.1 hypothetical protein NECHADRAFT_74969 [Fusarium vanettenii 77-13-4]